MKSISSVLDDVQMMTFNEGYNQGLHDGKQGFISWLKEQIEQKFKHPPYTEYTKESIKFMNDIYYKALNDVLSLLEKKE